MIPYQQKHGDPINEKAKDNITSINNKEKEEEKNIVKFYENNITLITPFVSEEIQTYLDDGLQEDLIIACMKEAVSRNKRYWKYIKTILDDCLNNNIKTKEQFYIKQKEFKSKNSKLSPKYKTKEKIEYEEVIFDNEQDYQNKLLGKET